MPFIKVSEEDEVVISGISGRFPNCASIEDLKKGLFNKEELLCDDDGDTVDIQGFPRRLGKVPNLKKFDASYFNVESTKVPTMDPQARFLLEHTYEAIVDAGVNPAELRGKRVAVIVGQSFTEAQRCLAYDRNDNLGSDIMVGCHGAAVSMWISYMYDLKGPSYTLDTACSASAYALEQSYRLIKSGECDAAIVAGSSINLHPAATLEFARLGVLSPDARCRPFDNDANGYVRSEALAALFLQRTKDAKRIYATVVHCKANSDGFKKMGITFPSTVVQRQLMKEFYEECQIPTRKLEFIEAHGTGTKAGDPEEVSAIDAVLLNGRTEPLKIGSVKGNIGHSEPSSCVCSIAKIIIAMETGLIPPNINYHRPRDALTAIIEGRLKVVTEATPWKGGYAALNSFGFGGANCHILLKSNTKAKINHGRPSDDLPRLVAISGSTEEAVAALLTSIENTGIDVEYIRLLHDIHTLDTPKHTYRGYTVVSKERSQKPIREIAVCKRVKKARPVWFVFSGIGSQWTGIGEMLMKFPVFAKAIQKCDAVLKLRGVDILSIISTKHKSVLDSSVDCFLGIAAIQIGMVDLLKAANIIPDKLVGQSIGELACAYADGSLTAEETILTAYALARGSSETATLRGSMAAVGVGINQLLNVCPKDIDVACSYLNSSIISGPAESINTFLTQLKAKGIFAKELHCSNIAYHSRYMSTAASVLTKYLKEVLPDRKIRNTKWLSTSVRRRNWSTEAGMFSSPDYYANNLLSAILFEQITKLVTPNAIVIDITPSIALQDTLRKSLPSTVSVVELSDYDCKDNIVSFLRGLGKLYNVGLQPNLANIFPPVALPVSVGTPMIAPNIRWAHSTDWYVPLYSKKAAIGVHERTVTFCVTDGNYDFMTGHVIDGRNLYPATGYIFFVWETFCAMMGCNYGVLPVVFENVRFERATTLSSDGIVKLSAIIHKGDGRFEVREGDTVIVRGFVRLLKNPEADMIPIEMRKEIPEDDVLTENDIYKELKIRGYEYQGLFRSLKDATISGQKGHIQWHDNWVAFMDTMLQLKILGLIKRSLFLPTGINKLVINVDAHQQFIRSIKGEEKLLPAYVYRNYDTIVSGGIELTGLLTKSVNRRKPLGLPVLEEYKFVANRDNDRISLKEIVIMSSHLVLETQNVVHFKALEIVEDEDDITEDQFISPILHRILKDTPLIQPKVQLATIQINSNDTVLSDEIQVIDPETMSKNARDSYIVIGYNLLSKKKLHELKNVVLLLRPRGFILTRESRITNASLEHVRELGLDVVLEKMADDKKFLLLKRRETVGKEIHVVKINSETLDWVENAKSVFKAVSESANENQQMILVTQRDKECGMLGLVNCLRREPGGEIVRAVIINDKKAPEFDPENSYYAEQLALNLPINILQDGSWGTYRHLPLRTQLQKPVRHAYIDQLVPADLSSFCWAEGPITTDDTREELIYSIYGSLNFKDAMLACGRITEDSICYSSDNILSLLGFEFSGVTSRGRRVMGLLNDSGFANMYGLERNIVFDVPDAWSLEDAATVPVVYTTCCVALYKVAKMKRGDKVLIHSGSGGVGQAAINLALAEGCEVFTTVGTIEKRKFIRDTFPSIDDNHIGNSRDTSFEYQIMEETNGRGVDIVLNSLAEDKLLASVRCLARNGRFVEIGKYDIAANNSLGLALFKKEISFHAVMMDRMVAGDSRGHEIIRRLLKKYMDNGAVKPIVRTVFLHDQFETAIRYMSTGKHIGKVLIKMGNENESLDKTILAYPRLYCLPNRSYIIIGGLGGMGLEVAQWLASREAKNLVLISRNGLKSGYQKMIVERLRLKGVNVQIIKGKDGSNHSDCEYILKTAEKIGPVDGIFNLAVLLKDALLTNQTVRDFEESLKPKVGITKVMDKLSRKICPQLRYFVVFSSASCGRGTAGQTNYGYANSVMERICERRVAEGLPGLAVQWGAVGDVGIVADMQKDNKAISISGTLQQTVSSCMQELERFLLQNHPVVSSMVVAEKTRGEGVAATPVEAVLKIMGLKAVNSANKNTPLSELGMDSIVAVEIREILGRDFDIFLTAVDMNNLNMSKLIQLSEKQDDVDDRLQTTNNNVALSGFQEMIDSNEMLECRGDAIDVKIDNVKSGNRILLFPGISNGVKEFSPLVKHLKYSTIFFEFPNDRDYLTIQSITEYLMPKVLEKTHGVTKLAVVGYSFGSIIAIEVARKLEASGYNLQIILLDGTPEIVKGIIRTTAESYKQQDIHSGAALAMADRLGSTAIAELTTRIEKCHTFDDKVKLLTELVPMKNLSVNYHEKVTRHILRRAHMSIVYDSSSLPKLQCPVTLIRCTEAPTKIKNMDHGLDKVTNGNITLASIDGDHATILNNPELPKIINDTFNEHEKESN